MSFLPREPAASRRCRYGCGPIRAGRRMRSSIEEGKRPVLGGERGKHCRRVAPGTRTRKGAQEAGFQERQTIQAARRRIRSDGPGGTAGVCRVALRGEGCIIALFCSLYRRCSCTGRSVLWQVPSREEGGNRGCRVAWLVKRLRIFSNDSKEQGMRKM